MAGEEGTSKKPPTAGAVITHGAALVFEELSDDRPEARLHADDDTLLRVVAGLVLISTETSDRVLGPGEEAIIPAGTAHRLSSICGLARIVTGSRRGCVGPRGTDRSRPSADN